VPTELASAASIHRLATDLVDIAAMLDRDHLEELSRNLRSLLDCAAERVEVDESDEETDELEGRDPKTE